MCLLWLGSRLLNYWMWVTGEVWPTSVYLWRHMFWPLSDVTCSIGYLPKGCFVCVCVYIVFPCGENHLISVVTWLPKIDIIATCHGPRVCACSCCGCDCCLCCFFYATHDSCVCVISCWDYLNNNSSNTRSSALPLSAVTSAPARYWYREISTEIRVTCDENRMSNSDCRANFQLIESYASDAACVCALRSGHTTDDALSHHHDRAGVLSRSYCVGNS